MYLEVNIKTIQMFRYAHVHLLNVLVAGGKRKKKLEPHVDTTPGPETITNPKGKRKREPKTKGVLKLLTNHRIYHDQIQFKSPKLESLNS